MMYRNAIIAVALFAMPAHGKDKGNMKAFQDDVKSFKDLKGDEPPKPQYNPEDARREAVFVSVKIFADGHIEHNARMVASLEWCRSNVAPLEKAMPLAR